MLGSERVKETIQGLFSSGEEQEQTKDGGADGADPESDAAGRECIISKIGLPIARITETDGLLARAGLIEIEDRGPIGVLKHAGQTGLRVVGLETSGPPDTGTVETAPRD